MIVGGGDSGSPVFRVTGTNTAELVGILWGGNSSGDMFVFSPLKNIQDELGSLDAILDGNGGGEENRPPVASFTYICSDLSCDFTDTSTDPDGTILSWDWDFGDGIGTSTAQNPPTYTYAAYRTYTVTLTVTDDGGATASDSQEVTVTEPSSGDITLTATGYKVRGVRYVDLEWSGATSEKVNILRDGSVIASPASQDGAYTDNLGRNSGTYIYQVCEPAPSTTCSNTATVIF
jgi:PKD repeat protein